SDPLVLANWITDLMVLSQRSDIHAGFLAALDAVWVPLKALLQRQAYEKPIFLTGHSLGGALAALAAHRMKQDSTLGVTASGVYTYGMPRVGSESFASAYGELNEVTYRFVYGEDVVASVPPSAWCYRHVGRRLSCERGERFDVSSLRNAEVD